MIIYEASYCDCIYESAFSCISLHKTEEGAKKAIKKHRQKLVRENRKYTIEYQKENPEAEPFKIQDWQRWAVFTRELED